MSNLEKQVRSSAENLKKLNVALQSRVPAHVPMSCIEKWNSQSQFYRSLESTLPLFPLRASAWSCLSNLAVSSGSNRDNRDFVPFSNEPSVDFEIARHMALSAFVAATWAIYDRCANVCGRIAGVVDLSENPKHNPKTCEQFFDKKDLLGFMGHFHLANTYKWPTKVCYKIRNWILHEGFEDTGNQLFRGHRKSDGFQLHPDAIDHLKNCCGYSELDGQIKNSSVEKSTDPWAEGDLLKILEIYHQEIDWMFMGFLKWTTESLTLQVKAFSERT